MIFTKKESLEDKIIRYLSNRNHTIHGLIDELNSEKIKATTQGIYKSIRFLISEEVVIKNKEVFSLNEEWRIKVIDQLENNKIVGLSENEKITLDLKSLIHLDQQWKNIVIPIQKTQINFPIFFYNPHDIWSLISTSRKQSEDEYYSKLFKSKTFVFINNGGNTIFDKNIKKIRENNYTQINLGNSLFNDTDYITIIGDYITTVRIPKSIASKINKSYTESRNDDVFYKSINEIGIEKKKVKLFIERNHEKAKKLRKRVAKDFYIPRELREKFDLF